MRLDSWKAAGSRWEALFAEWRRRTFHHLWVGEFFTAEVSDTTFRRRIAMSAQVHGRLYLSAFSLEHGCTSEKMLIMADVSEDISHYKNICMYSLQETVSKIFLALLLLVFVLNSQHQIFCTNGMNLSRICSGLFSPIGLVIENQFQVWNRNWKVSNRMNFI